MARGGDEGSGRITRRGLAMLGLQAGVVGALGWRMHDLQIVQNEHYRTLAEENRVSMRLIPPARGMIFDREGRVLAENRQNYRIVMVREQARDAQAVLDRLGMLIELPQDRRERALREMAGTSAFVPVVVTEHLTWEDVVRVTANAPVLPGVIAEVGLSRHYPFGAGTAHVVGYVGPVSERDLEALERPDPVLRIPRFQIGKNGVEQRLEDSLRGEAGAMRLEISAAGRIMRELGRTEGTSGNDIQLTIDQGVQDYAMQRMAGESAASVVMDVTNGDLVAIAAAPGFDPNSFVFGIGAGEWNALLADEYRPLSNKTVSGTYPPGSTFKLVVALAVLEGGHVRPGDTVSCSGFTDLGNHRFHCWRRGGHGRVDLRRSLAQSCDVYYYEMARRAGPDAIAAMARRIGLGVRNELPMSAIAEGNMPDREWKRAARSEAWTTGDSYNYGIGQGFSSASPLQLAVMSARLATGAAVRPRLVRAIGGVPVPVEPAAPLGLDPDWLRRVQDGMYAVSNDGGTAMRSRIADPENLMAGKTGTSQVRRITAAERAGGIRRGDQLPWNLRNHALFVAYAPYAAPRYAIATVVEHGGGGSAAAAPIARDILIRALYGPNPPLTAWPAEQREEIERLRALQPEPPEAAAPPERDRA
ncbi:penicillin-binding protein 2 [soil metagenome]